MFCLIVCEVSVVAILYLTKVIPSEYLKVYLLSIGALALFCVCSVLLFVTLMSRALFCKCSVDCLLRKCIVHCFVCVLLTVVTLVSRALFCMCSVNCLSR